MEKQVLSINQMQNLKELGVDTSKASLTWMLHPYDENKEPGISLRKWSTFKEPFREYHCVPAFTLQDIINIIPEIIDAHIFTIEKKYGLWSCMYLESCTRSIIRIKTNKELINAAYEMLCWCAENGYLNKK